MAQGQLREMSTRTATHEATTAARAETIADMTMSFMRKRSCWYSPCVRQGSDMNTSNVEVRGAASAASQRNEVERS